MIPASHFACVVSHEAPKDGKGPSSDGEIAKKLNQKKNQRYEKVTVDYKQDILGKWEGHITSDMGSEFDDGEDHQWEYLDDDTFRFYVQDFCYVGGYYHFALMKKFKIEVKILVSCSFTCCS